MWNVTIYIKGHDAGDRTIWVDNIKDVERRTRKKLSETIGLNGIKNTTSISIPIAKNITQGKCSPSI